MSYAKKNLRDVEDFAAKHGLSDHQEARFPRGDLGTEQTGLNYLIVKPGQREAFAHRHHDRRGDLCRPRRAGRVKLDDELVELAPLDAVPRRARARPGRSKPAPTDSRCSIFGPRVEGDARDGPGLLDRLNASPPDQWRLPCFRWVAADEPVLEHEREVRTGHAGDAIRDEHRCVRAARTPRSPERPGTHLPPDRPGPSNQENASTHM